MQQGRKKGSWFDALVDYSPILALLLGWLTIAAKAAKMENPYTWILGVTTLPAVLAIVYSAVVIYGRRRKAKVASRG